MVKESNLINRINLAGRDRAPSRTANRLRCVIHAISWCQSGLASQTARTRNGFGADQIPRTAGQGRHFRHWPKVQ
jgi:hypothetical protein